jgi:hypothetical protein
MKKVSITWEKLLNPVNTIYENTGVKFSWLGKSKEKNVFYQVTNWHSCRETFAGEICKFVSSIKPSRWIYKQNIDLKKTRIAVTRRHNKKSFVEATKSDLKWMRCSTRIINIFEKTQGWSLTHVSMCEDLNLSKNGVNTFVFVSSVKWMQAPQLLSLYLLLIRLGCFYKEFNKFRKVEDLNEIVNSIISKENSMEKADLRWLNQTWTYWMLILNNHNILFFNKSLEENYRANSGSCGIKLLIDGYGDKDTRDTWRKIVYQKSKNEKEINKENI